MGQTVKHSVLGSPDSSIVMYFHGVHGAISEALVFDAHANANGLKIICQDRFALDANFTKLEYFQALADDIGRLAKGKQVDVVGFSMVPLLPCMVDDNLLGRLTTTMLAG